jgi:hypothetical protein
MLSCQNGIAPPQWQELDSGKDYHMDRPRSREKSSYFELTFLEQKKSPVEFAYSE